MLFRVYHAGVRCPMKPWVSARPNPLTREEAASPVNPYDKHRVRYSTHPIVAMRKGWNADSSSQWSKRSRNDYRRISLWVAVRLRDHRGRGNSHVSDLYEQ